MKTLKENTHRNRKINRQRLLFGAIKRSLFQKRQNNEFIHFKTVEMHIGSCGPVLELIVNKEACCTLCDANYGRTNISQSAGVGGVREHLGPRQGNPRI